MTIRRLDQFVALFLAFFGVYLVWAGLQYGFMQGTTPGAGFFPVLMGIGITALSIVNFWRSAVDLEQIKASMTRSEVMKFAGIVVAMVIFVGLCDPLGITIATMLLMAAIGLIIRPSLDRAFLLRLALSSLLVPIGCRYLFGDVLRVPLPTGPFGF